MRSMIQGSSLQRRALARSLALAGCAMLFVHLGSYAQAPATRLRAIDYLDGAILVDAYLDHQKGGFVAGTKLAHGKVRDVLEIPIGSIDASTGGSAPGGFSVQLVTIDDLETPGVFHFLYVGKGRLGRDEYGPGQETCLRYEPLPERRVALGALIGFGRSKPVADPGPLARLLHVMLDDVDGVILRVPGTMEVCGPDAIHTLSVVSPEGVCSVKADGAATRYRCEHMEGEVVRGSAELVVDPSATPPASCIGGKGGACSAAPYPSRPQKPPEETPPPPPGK